MTELDNKHKKHHKPQQAPHNTPLLGSMGGGGGGREGESRPAISLAEHSLPRFDRGKLLEQVQQERKQKQEMRHSR